MCKITLTKQMTADERFSKCDFLSQHQVAPKIFAVHWTDWFTICRWYFTSAVLTIFEYTLLVSKNILIWPSRKGISPKSAWNIAFRWNTRANYACRSSISTVFSGWKYIKQCELNQGYACAPGDVSLYWTNFTTNWNQMKYLTILLNREKWLEWSMKSTGIQTKQL